jgi:hypothetical protein
MRQPGSCWELHQCCREQPVSDLGISRGSSALFPACAWPKAWPSMSTSGLGRGLGSLMEPKNWKDAKRPTSRGFGALIGDSASAPADSATKPGTVPSPVPSASGGVPSVLTPGLAQAPTAPSSVGARVPGVLLEPKTSEIGKNSPIPRILLGADAILVALAGWILMSPAWRGHREGVVFGVVLMALATTLGLVGTLDRRR